MKTTTKAAVPSVPKDRDSGTHAVDGAAIHAVRLRHLDAALGGVKRYCPSNETASAAELLLNVICFDPYDFEHDGFEAIADELSILYTALGNEDETTSTERLRTQLYRLERRCTALAEISRRVTDARLQEARAAKAGAE